MPLEIQSHTIPHLKALISGKMEPRGLRCSSLFILCQTLWKNTSLLHKMRFVWLVLATTVKVDLMFLKMIFGRCRSKNLNVDVEAKPNCSKFHLYMSFLYLKHYLILGGTPWEAKVQTALVNILICLSFSRINFCLLNFI